MADPTPSTEGRSSRLRENPINDYCDPIRDAQGKAKYYDAARYGLWYLDIVQLAFYEVTRDEINNG